MYQSKCFDFIRFNKLQKSTLTCILLVGSFDTFDGSGKQKKFSVWGNVQSNQSKANSRMNWCKQVFIRLIIPASILIVLTHPSWPSPSPPPLLRAEDPSLWRSLWTPRYWWLFPGNRGKHLVYTRWSTGSRVFALVSVCLYCNNKKEQRSSLLSTRCGKVLVSFSLIIQIFMSKI